CARDSFAATLEGHLQGDEASRADGAMGSLRATWGGVRGVISTHLGMPALAFAIWSALALAVLLWMWGLNPLVFPSPDEAVVRYAAQVISEHGSPILQVPFPDPEDMAHPRGWVTLGDRVVPTYAPVSLYLLGYLLRLGRFGLLLVAVFPATAVGAFAAGTALLLPPKRRWLALFAPPLAFPGLYWLLRPWVNISPLLTCLCWAFFFWARWRRTDKLRDLSLSAAFVALGTAIRPDYAAFLLLAALLLSLAASPPSWKAVFVVFTLAGVCALGSNLFLNKALTGHPLQAAYQVALDRQWGPQDTGSSPGLGVLRVLFVPMGWPIPKIAVTVFTKYWLTMGPIAGVLVGQLAIIPLARESSRLSRVLYGALFLLCAFFVYTRLHDDVFGGREPIGWAEHSVPRYLSPAYLLAAVPPLLLLGRLKRKLLWIPGLLLICGVAFSGLYDIAIREPSSFHFLHDFMPKHETMLRILKREIPARAMVYTVTSDKVVWSHWRLGTIDDLNLTAASIERAVKAGLDVFMLDQRYETPSHRRLGVLLARRSLVVVPVDPRRGTYRVRAGASPPLQR
ncbi:MAG TPA: hypothetical protein VIK01_29220, partial [Polyangiaceae bacterium]